MGDSLAQLNLLVWLALILVAALTVFLFRTPQGLRLRSVGENPLAADTAGISPIRVRYRAVIRRACSPRWAACSCRSASCTPSTRT